MRVSRVYVDVPLSIGTELILPKDCAHYLTNVLRLRAGAAVVLFNGNGCEYHGKVNQVDKKAVTVLLEKQHSPVTESPLSLMLVQAIARPEHMDYSLQKAVELGVSQIVPVLTERSPPFDWQRSEKRQQHWAKIISSAAEQCARNQLPALAPAQPLEDWLTHTQPECALVLTPTAERTIAQLSLAEPRSVAVLIGAEGGLTEAEIFSAMRAGYQPIRLGPRILRTETAASTMLSLCQLLWGDLR